MKLALIFEEAALSSEQQDSFDNLFQRIQSKVKQEAGYTISPHWLAGLAKQYLAFDKFDDMYKKFEEEGRTNSAKDLKGRIVARNALASVGLLDKNNGYLPRKKATLSAMREYYTSGIHRSRINNDAARGTRQAMDAEYTDWLKSLDPQQQHYVKCLQELSPEEWAQFRGIVQAREDKQEFMTRLHKFVNQDDVGAGIMRQMGLITDEGKISSSGVEGLRNFLAGLNDTRLKDVISKASLYAHKADIHTTHRNKNAVLMSMEKDPSGSYGRMLKLYNLISAKVKDLPNSQEAFRKILSRVPSANDGGKLTPVGLGAMQLFKMYKGQALDPVDAVKKLKDRYFYSADREKRAEKAGGRLGAIRKQSGL